MHDEQELRFLDVNYDQIRQKLSELGAVQQYPLRSMRRVIIDYPDQRIQHGVKDYWAFIRLRDEGDKVQLTYKQIAKNDAYDTQEIELTVSSWDDMIQLFEKVGLVVISEQHTRREVWHLNDCDISLDEWPWLPPMLEIEGRDYQTLQKIAEALGLSVDDHIPGNVVTAYRRMYPGMTEEDSVRDIPKLTFEEFPQWLKDRQKPLTSTENKT